MRNIEQSALLTDLYQLTMLHAYVDEAMEDLAVFEFFVRRMPDCRNFLVAAGMEQVIQYLEQLKFTNEEIQYLEKDGRFNKKFLDYLKTFKFSGDVYGVEEGTIIFPNEPILQVIAPITQAQFIESRIINLLQYQTMIASKAARCVLSAPNKLLVDFGMRRAHGAEAALLSSRANYIAGFTGTATVIAGMQYDLPTFGTMAHSYVQAHNTEEEAFYAFAQSHPENVVLLIDTYDTEAGAHKVTELAPKLKQEGINIKAVRIDSGNLGEHAKNVRNILDKAGWKNIKIFCSGDLDEYKLQDLLQHKYPIDGFGIGTKLDTSNDAPYLDCAYKLQEYAGVPRRKRSEGKATWPGRKQIYRYFEADKICYDVLSLYDDNSEDGVPLLKPMMKQGKRMTAPLPLAKIQQQTVANLAQLPAELAGLEKAEPKYDVKIAQVLQDLADEVDKMEK